MSRSERPSIFTKGTHAAVAGLTVTLLVVALLVVVSMRDRTAAPAATESSAQSTPSSVASTLSLIVDLTRGKLRLSMDGTTVWDTPLILASDSDEVASFAENLSRDEIGAAFIRRVHLFGGSRPVPDSILTIVARAENLPLQHLQRYLPERFLIELSNGSSIDVITDVSGEAVSRFDNALETGRSLWRSLAGGSRLRIQLPGKEGMSLYGASRPGVAVLVR